MRDSKDFIPYDQALVQELRARLDTCAASLGAARPPAGTRLVIATQGLSGVGERVVHAASIAFILDAGPGGGLLSGICDEREKGICPDCGGAGFLEARPERISPKESASASALRACAEYDGAIRKVFARVRSAPERDDGGESGAYRIYIKLERLGADMRPRLQAVFAEAVTIVPSPREATELRMPHPLARAMMGSCGRCDGVGAVGRVSA